MGLIQVPNIQEYWSTASNSRVPFFPETFTRARFMQIFWMLHLAKPTRMNATLRTRIQKVSNYLEYIDTKFRQYFIPYEAKLHIPDVGQKKGIALSVPTGKQLVADVEQRIIVKLA